jgi:hypothetical protein
VSTAEVLGELVEGVLEVQFPDREVRAVFEHRPDAIEY